MALSSFHPAVAAYLLQENGKVKRMLEQERQRRLVVVSDEELDQDEYKCSAPGNPSGEHGA